MVDPQLFAAFLAATAALIITPGPVVTLVIATAAARGPGPAVYTVAGAHLASIIHLSLVAAGLATLLNEVAGALEILRWVGAAALIWIGWRTWVEAGAGGDPHRKARAASPKALFWTGFAANMSNPKTIFFLAGFFPLFISSELPATPQLLIMSLAFLVIGFALDMTYAFAAGRARRFFAHRGPLLGRLSGGVLMAAGLGLALIRRDA